MKQQELLDVLINVVKGIAKLLGEDTEVVLHDLHKREIVEIVNGRITKREKGYQLERSVYDIILQLADEDGHLIGYGSKSSNGKKLRSSHFLFKDEAGEPSALICINQDTSKLEAAKDVIESLIALKPLDEGKEETEEFDDKCIQNAMRAAILKSIENLKPININTKEGKMTLLRKLKSQGIFDVKDSVPYVCGILSISQATLYNYLREIRKEESFGEGSGFNL
jgi:predicted transcriptional regulator YheO